MDRMYLKHSTEMAHMAGIIAEEVGANVKISKYAALVHDLGKASDTQDGRKTPSYFCRNVA
jgi:putative nucleotidyltransferase with HDIG domain